MRVKSHIKKATLALLISFVGIVLLGNSVQVTSASWSYILLGCMPEIFEILKLAEDLVKIAQQKEALPQMFEIIQITNNCWSPLRRKTRCIARNT